MEQLNLKDLGEGMYLQVLGCGSGRPTRSYHPSAQVLRLRDKYFLIDCGEGTQMQMMRYHIPISQIYNIFISHLHGDHVLGLPGLISTMRLTGLEHPVHIFGPQGIKKFVEKIIYFFVDGSTDDIIVHEIPDDAPRTIIETHSYKVTAFPLQHRITTIGYRFDEAEKQRHLNRSMADFYDVPIAYYGLIKQGHDYIRPDGTTIPNHLLTNAPRPSYSYVYASDSIYQPLTAEVAKGADLLYHEATFAKEMQQRAKETMHSTTIDAAQVAKEAGVGHLLIGHYSARYAQPPLVEKLRQECVEIFPNSLAAEEGRIYDLSALRQEK